MSPPAASAKAGASLTVAWLGKFGLALAVLLAIAVANAAAADQTGPPTATCQAFTFDPNPIATSGDPGIRDDPEALTNERVEQDLTGLADLDKGILRNEFVSLTSDSGKPYLLGVGCDNLKFGWRDPRFAFVTAYAAMARAQNWLSDIGEQDALPRGLRVVISTTQQASEFQAATRTLVIGSRQCTASACRCGPANASCPLSDDQRQVWPYALDADIVVHEYGHAILHQLVCGETTGCEFPVGQLVTAMDEAFADYLASAVKQSTSKKYGDPFCFGEWYNSLQNRTGPCTRRLDSNLHWPEAARALRDQLPYGYASIWASALFKARQAIPAPERGLMDRMVLEAYRGLVSEMTFEAMAARLVDAASRIEDGKYEPLLRAALREQGFLIDLGQPGTAREPAPGVAGGDALSNRTMPAFPVFDQTSVYTVTGASGLRLLLEDVRLKAGNCVDEPCGRLYVSDANGGIYQIVSERLTKYESVVVPGDTISLRFVASFDHPRTTIYKKTGIQVINAP